MEQHHEIHVVGGGLAGLTAAAFVARAGHRAVVHETRGRLGGRATTDERDGHRFNQGPHALYRSAAGARALRELGIAVRGTAPRPAGLLVRDGEQHLLPSGPASLVRTSALGWREKAELARLLVTVPRLDATALADRTVAHWLDERIHHDRVRAIAETLVRLTTYVDAPDELAADVAVDQLQLALDDGVVYPEGGWEQLVEALRAVPGVDVVTDDACAELPDAAAVVVAAGGPEACGRLVGTAFDVGPAAESACLDLALDGEPATSFALGVDRPVYLSQHSIAGGLAPAGQSNVSLVQYLATGTEPDRKLLRGFAREVGISDDRVRNERYLHRMTAVSAIATADRGGRAGRPRVDGTGRAGVFVAGDWVGPTGHLADAAIASGREAALAAVRHVERLPVAG